MKIRKWFWPMSERWFWRKWWWYYAFVTAPLVIAGICLLVIR